MNIAIESICPLGSKCEEVKGDKVLRCHWYVALKGKDPQSGDIVDKWGCAMSWLPVLLIENAQVARGTSAAIESFRNETIKGQNAFNLFLAKVAEKRISS